MDLTNVTLENLWFCIVVVSSPIILLVYVLLLNLNDEV